MIFLICAVVFLIVGLWIYGRVLSSAAEVWEKSPKYEEHSTV